jgi:hypothetical protein
MDGEGNRAGDGGASGRGVRFEEYDLGEIKTVDGLATFGPYKTAWMKDPDGNILEISEVPDQ